MASLENLMSATYVTPTPESVAADKAKRQSRKRAGVNSHSSISRRDTSTYENYYGSYDDRYQKAIDAGMDTERAKQYASSYYTEANDTWASGFAKLFGGKSPSELSRETNLAKDAELFRSLLDEQKEFNLNSPEAEVVRRQAAGLNDALNGGSEIGTGDTSGLDDQSMTGLSDAISHINDTSADFPMRVAESLMTSLGGVMNLINSGVDISRSLYSMDTEELNNIMNGANSVADLGSFLPMLGYTFDDQRKFWLDSDGNEVTSATLQDIGYDTFLDAISKSSGFRTRRIKKDMWSLYKSMFSPKAINSYLSSLKENIELQNSIPTEMAKGIAITGGLTHPSRRFNIPDFLANSPLFNIETSPAVLTKYLNTSAELFKLGIETNVSEYKNTKAYNDRYAEIGGPAMKAEADFYTSQFDKTRSETKEKVMSAVIDLISTLQTESSKGDMFSTYLLVNMMSNEFNGIGEAAMFSVQPNKPQTISDLFNILTDASMLSFVGLKDLLPMFGKGMPMGPMK